MVIFFTQMALVQIRSLLLYVPILIDWPGMSSVKEDIKDTVLGVYEAVLEKWTSFIEFIRETWPLLSLLLAGLALVW
jgi:hypothetical protein